MTKDEAIKVVQDGIVPLEGMTIEGGLKPIALALGMTVSSRPIKADLITSIKAKVAAELATTPQIIPVVPVVPPADAAVQAASQKKKFPTEDLADRIFNWMFKRR